MSLPVAILAGGLATRLRPLTERIPKSLVEVAGRPFVEHQLALLQRAGVTDVVLLVGHLGEPVRDALGNGSRWGLRAQCVFDGPAALGTGGALRRALPVLGDPFFVLYGDSYLDCEYAAIERAFLHGGRLGLMTVYCNENRGDQSNVVFEGGRIVRYDKVNRTAAMRHIDYGLGVLRHAAFAHHADGEAFDLASLYQDLLARDELDGFEVPSRFYEIGSPQGLEETRALLTEREGKAR